MLMLCFPLLGILRLSKLMLLALALSTVSTLVLVFWLLSKLLLEFLFVDLIIVDVRLLCFDFDVDSLDLVSDVIG